MKYVLKTIIIVVLIYATFILIESMQLENNHTKEPLINLKKYPYNGILMRGSFVLFDTFTIWEWVQW